MTDKPQLPDAVAVALQLVNGRWVPYAVASDEATVKSKLPPYGGTFEVREYRRAP